MHRIMAVGEVLCVWYLLELSTGQVADPSPVSISKLTTFDCNSSFSSTSILQFFKGLPLVLYSKTREIQGDRLMRILGS